MADVKLRKYIYKKLIVNQFYQIREITISTMCNINLMVILLFIQKDNIIAVTPQNIEFMVTY